MQGLTEFLPVSSSGHLVLGRQLLGVRPGGGVTFEVAVHFGTVLSILTMLRSRIARIFVEREWRLVAYLALASVPAAVVGLLFKKPIERAFHDIGLVSVALLATGGMLWATRWVGEATRSFDLPRVLAVGVAQALAILPGISRSGSTTCVALFCGVDRQDAAEFSLLMAVPVILGATLLELRKLLGGPAPDSWQPLLWGTGVAYLSGCLAIVGFLAAVRRGRLDVFGLYCALVGLGGGVAWFCLT